MTKPYPEFSEPPRGWTAARFGAGVKLVPPGAYADRCRASMVVSPLVPVNEQMPEVKVILQQALSAEVAATGLKVESQSEMKAVATASGLQGVRWELVLKGPDSNGLEKRIYTMYRDAHWLYGLHYLSDVETYPFFLDTYESVAASILVAPKP